MHRKWKVADELGVGLIFFILNRKGPVYGPNMGLSSSHRRSALVTKAVGSDHSCRRCGEKEEIRVSWRSEISKGTMIYDVNSHLFRSFLSQKGGSSDKRFSMDGWSYIISVMAEVLIGHISLWTGSIPSCREWLITEKLGVICMHRCVGAVLHANSILDFVFGFFFWVCYCC